MGSAKLTAGRTRWYDEGCGVAFALELAGERWSLLVMRELIFGPRRFGELRAALPALSANVLTQRLAGLEASGIVVRHRLPPPVAAQAYALTPWGRESAAAMRALAGWSMRAPGYDPAQPWSAAALMLSLGTTLSPDRPPGLALQLAFRFGADAFAARLDAAGLAVDRGEPVEADVRFTATPAALAAVLYGGRPLGEAIAAGDVAVAGSRAMALLFVRLFPLPH